MLGSNPRCGSVRTAEHDGAAHLPAGHVKGFGRRVHDLVDRLHREVPGHELDDRLEAGEGRTHADTGESLLRNRRIDHPFLAELVEQPLAHLIGALVLPNLLAHQEYVRVAAHLLGHGVAQSFAHGLGDHLRAWWKIDLRGHLARWSYCWRG